MFRQFRRLPALLVPLLCSCILWPDLPLADTTLQAIPQEELSEGTDFEASQALRPGGTVRLKTSLPRRRLEGVIRSFDDTQITVVDEERQEVSVPWTSINHLEVQDGLRHRYGTWALIGGGVGAFLGLIAPNHKECFAPGCPDEEAFSRSQAVVIGSIAGVLGGLWAEGTSQPSAPKWKRVRLPYRPSPAASLGLEITPGQNGVAFRLVVGF